ncbi:MAG: DUF1801 domain-containing protein [Saprospiraceae bacterium]
MKKPQEVDFRNIGELLDYLPEHELHITEFLRALILDNVPEVREKLAYNVPFYYLNSRFCFIWPGCIPWGGKGRQGVRLGFTKGQLLSDEQSLLKKDNLKEIAYVDFGSIKDIPIEIVKNLIFEAVALDQEFNKKAR